MYSSAGLYKKQILPFLEENKTEEEPFYGNQLTQLTKW